MKKLVEYIKKINSSDYKPKGLDFILIYFIIFFIGCIIGWIYEELFFYFVDNILENRGFMYGPYLPVYGFGALFMLLFLKPLKKYPPLVFILSMLVTGVLEYFTGYMMYFIWHKRWWDYTGLFLNIDGYVCLRSVITFAIGGIALIYFIEPFIKDRFVKCPRKVAVAVCIIIAVVMLTDLTLSFMFRAPAVAI